MLPMANWVLELDTGNIHSAQNFNFQNPRLKPRGNVVYYFCLAQQWRLIFDIGGYGFS